MFRSKLLVGFQTFAVFIILLCSSTSQGRGAEDLVALQQSPEAPDFILPDIGGAVHRLSDYRGEVVMITFWASWCPQCLWEMPSIQGLWESLKQSRFVVLAVNVGDDSEKVSEFMSRSGISFPVLLDQDLAVYKEWPVLGLPTTIVLNRRGIPVYRAVGALDWQDDSLVQVIRSLLTEVL